ncbi:FAD-dependent monooxygenase [Pseudonocardia humida]|uniref:FAD-dependent monooxygenase n=1 Tax=Pseudonocardia humida TaxID=2800819 RepID=UPI00207D2842|nr:FAD-dependent monooxygenase [Pseudonocardia humida]
MPVLLAGGGLVGLTTALLLRQHGVEVTLVEKRATTSAQPKARRFHTRSMEVFRELGLAATVHDAAKDLVGHDHMAAGRTLAEAERLPLWSPPGSAEAEADISPEPPTLIAQDLLEPVLRAAAVDAGASVRFQTELTAFDQRDDGVVVELVDHGRGERESLRAQYLVAADGARSRGREALGITGSGRGAVGAPTVSAYFRADLGEVVRGREFNLCHISHPAAPGVLASVDGRHRWVYMGPDGLDHDWPALLRTALGVPAPELEVLSLMRWRAEMLVADRFRAGRVLLAGDAAHVMPPFAAAGANTGILDAHNLAWKLAAVLSGRAGPGLLDSYDAERRAAGWFAADQSTRRTAGFADPTAAADPTLAHPYVLAGGRFRYPAGALVLGPDDVADAEPVTEYAPAVRVGTPLPHRWLDAARTRSTVDLAGPGWALLSGGPTAATAVEDLPVHAVELDGLPPGRCALVRPDQVVAWRGDDPATATRVRADLLAAPVTVSG